MTVIRSVLLLSLSLFSISALFYYTVLPQGPQLFRLFESSANSVTSSEMTIRAKKFTPE